MIIIVIERLTDDATPPPDIPGERVTLELNELPSKIETLEDTIEYLLEHRHVLPHKITRVLELSGAHPLTRKPQ